MGAYVHDRTMRRFDRGRMTTAPSMLSASDLVPDSATCRALEGSAEPHKSAALPTTWPAEAGRGSGVDLGRGRCRGEGWAACSASCPGPPLTAGQVLSDLDVSALAETACAVVTSVYDAESFVILTAAGLGLLTI